MKRIHKLVLSTLLLALISNVLYCSNTDPREKVVVISGKVLDLNQNELLAGVCIKTTNCEKTIYSDLNGNFFIYIKTKSTENFKIEFSQVGYQTKTLTSADFSGMYSDLEISLTEH